MNKLTILLSREASENEIIVLIITPDKIKAKIPWKRHELIRLIAKA
jgi:hypothetical protein